MGIVRQQSIRSSIFIYLGFAVGAFNVLVLFTHYLTAEQYGLMQLLLGVGLLTSSLASLGTVPVINKFFPFYNDYLSPKKNDLPLLTIAICIIGFALFVICSIIFKGLIIRKYSANSPLFIHYYFLIYPVTFFLLLFTLLESFAWGLRKTVLTNFLRETVVRIYATPLILLVALGWLGFDGFIKIYSFLFAVPAIILLFFLLKSGQFQLYPRISHVTRRLRQKMLIFSSYIFGGNIFNLLAKSIEIFFISSINGLADAGRYSIGDYAIRFMDIPQRSMAAITTPLVAAHWKNKEYYKIQELYRKSSATLLIFGFFIFGIIWLNVDNFLIFLPGKFSSPDIKNVILILGIGKIIDLGTGINNQIIQTSSFWRFDFFSNIFFTTLSIPLNYFLIHRYGILGAAYTVSLSLTIFNAIRFIFLWWKFNFQPFTYKTGLVIILGIVAFIIAYLLPFLGNIYLDTITRSFVFALLFLFGILKVNASEDINLLWQKWSNKAFGWIK